MNGGTIPPNAGQIKLVNCSSVEVANQNLSHTSVGLLAAYSPYLNIHDTLITENSDGIVLIESDNSMIINTKINKNSGSGIRLEPSDNVIITDNRISHNGEGISLLADYYGEYGIDPTENAMIARNIFLENYQGIYLHNGRWCSIQNNTFKDNTGYAIHLASSTMYHKSSGNEVKWNDFIRNNPNGSSQARDDGTNVFEYNHWSEWTSLIRMALSIPHIRLTDGKNTMILIHW